jgi:hypothetical protein
MKKKGSGSFKPCDENSKNQIAHEYAGFNKEVIKHRKQFKFKSQ